MTLDNTLNPSSPFPDNFLPSPLRKSQQHTLNTSFPHDDNAERIQRRSLIGLKKNLPLQKSNDVNNVDQMQDHFQWCVKMFMENKITQKNVWNFKAIEYIDVILKQQPNKNVLQVGATSLEVCSKVYGLKVDDVYATGMQLASNLARNIAKNQDNDVTQDEKDGIDQPKVKKRANKKLMLKCTTVKDNSITANISKLDYNHFQTKSDADSSVDYLFTSTLHIHPQNFQFLLLSNEKLWKLPSDDNSLEKINQKTYNWPINSAENKYICKQFLNFEINEWDPNEESHLFQKSFDNVVLDDKGIPVAELDGSLHDVFTSQDQVNDIILNEEEGQYQIHNDPEHIVSFKPEDFNITSNGYSYVSFNSPSDKKLAMQLWAGPSHWKLKYVKPVALQFSGIQEKKIAKKSSSTKEKLVPCRIDFSNCPELTKSKNKSRRAALTKNSKRFTIPENLEVQDFEKNGVKLARKPLIIYPKNPNRKSKNLEEDLPYNYYNPNDSQYCPQHSLQQSRVDNFDDDNVENDYNNEDQEVEEFVIRHDNFQGENLVTAPQLVKKDNITYALTAKKLDMKKLKEAVWKCLPLDEKNNSSPNSTTFSEISREVPNLLPEKIKKELSTATIFVALLHLTNERNLEIKRNKNDITDFQVQKGTNSQ